MSFTTLFNVGWRMISSRSLLLSLLISASTPGASAHDVYTAYIQHRVHLSVGANHLDVTVDLTFFEEWSARERGRIDADGDGQVGRSETQSY